MSNLFNKEISIQLKNLLRLMNSKDSKFELEEFNSLTDNIFSSFSRDELNNLIMFFQSIKSRHDKLQN